PAVAAGAATIAGVGPADPGLAIGPSSPGAAASPGAAGTVNARPQRPRANRERIRMRELLSPVRSPSRASDPTRAGDIRTRATNGTWAFLLFGDGPAREERATPQA